MDTESIRLDLDLTLEVLKEDLMGIRTGRATPELVENILVNAYDTQAPIKNYAGITVADARSIVIQPWDKSILDNISKAISTANLGFSPITEGDRVRVTIPDLTEERRQEYVKIMKDRVEEARVAVRSIRQKFMKDIDELQKEGLSEDDAKRAKEDIERIVKEYNEEIEELKDEKEKDLLTI